MELKDKKIEDLLVYLPLADGTELECNVVTMFDIIDKTYAALRPTDQNGKPDPSAQLMLYRVDEDENREPIISYIEDDNEYEAAAAMFTVKYAK